MRSILPKFLLASAVMATAALATNNALAETMVNVPFSFTVNGKTCPAGRYTVDRNLMTGVVTLRNDDWKRGFMWIAGSGEPAPGDSRVILREFASWSWSILRQVKGSGSVARRVSLIQ